MLRKKTSALVIIPVLIVLLSAAPSGAANRDIKNADAVRIGILAPVQLPVGQAIINTAKMAADEINAGSGILGKKIELFIGDTESKPEKGVTAMKRLVLEDKVDILIGEYNSGVALAIQPFLSGYKIVFISTGTASPDLCNNVKKDYAKNKYFFRNMVNSDRLQKLYEEFLIDFPHGKFGYKRFALLAENAKWTEEMTPNMKKNLEKAGLEVPFVERFDVEIKDFSPIFSKIKSLQIQWICQIVSHSASISLVKAWQDNKPCPMGGNDVTSQDAKFWEMTNGACLGEITLSLIARCPVTDKTIPFWDAYVKRFGTTPVYAGGYTYDSVHMAAEVMKQQKSMISDDLIKGLETISYKGIMHGAVAYDKENHDIMEGRYIGPYTQWQAGGKQVIIYPENIKTGDYVKPAWWK